MVHSYFSRGFLSRSVKTLDKKQKAGSACLGEVDDMKARAVAKTQAADVDEDDVRTEEFAGYLPLAGASPNKQTGSRVQDAVFCSP